MSDAHTVNDRTGTIELHVSPRGNDAAEGSLARPLATLDGARERLRLLRKRGGESASSSSQLAAKPRAACGAATVFVHAGTYTLARSFVLSREDSGGAGSPVVYRAWNDDTVRITGGRSIDSTQLRPVGDPSILARLSPAFASRVAQIDLASMGIDVGENTPHGFSHPVGPAWIDLYHNDTPLPIARWPREGYTHTGKVLDPGAKLGSPGLGDGDAKVSGATFAPPAVPLNKWKSPTDLRCFGMWRAEWAPATVPVASIDAANGTITLGSPTAYGVLEDKEFRVLNALEEITSPGDWAVDHTRGVIYLLPPHNAAPNTFCVSVLREPLIVLDGASHIVLRGLTVECGRWHGVSITGDDNLIAGCTLRNLGGMGVVIDGARNAARACHIYQTGQGGIRLSGGDRRTLTPGENLADNNEVHDFNRVCTTYNPAVHLVGVGQRVSHNLVYDGPHNAILLHGNDHVIECNEFHHLAVETSDAAAFYMGRNPSEQGNVLRHNFFHHIGAYAPWGTSAIYVDDCACGTAVLGNIFYRCGYAGQVAMAAIFNNGGKDHVIDGNIFVECLIAIGILLPTQKHWEEFIAGKAKNMEFVGKWLYEDVDIRSEIYRERYPALRDLAPNAARNTVKRNLAVRCGKFLTPEERQDVADNLMTHDDPGFADMARLNFTLAPDAPAARAIPGFVPPPFARMGLRIDEYRAHLPARTLVESRLEIIDRPTVSRPGEAARFRVVLHAANVGDQHVSGRFVLWCKPEGAITPLDGGPVTIELSPGEVARREIELRVTAQPDAPVVLGVRREGEMFSLPIPVRPLYRVALPRVEPGAELSFLSQGKPRGVLRVAVVGDTLALHAVIHDENATPENFPPANGDNLWGGPLLGVLVAPHDATDTGQVRQVIFFPHATTNQQPRGDNTTGTVWSYHGTTQGTPNDITWSARALRVNGWELSARIPLHHLGLTSATNAFRFEAMANYPGAAGERATLLTLFGSKTARLEIETLAHASVGEG